MFRSLMKFGDIEKNIPVMDPYIFNTKQARVHALVNCEVNTTNGVISGLSNFLLEDFAFTKDQVALGVIVKIPVIKFDAEYYEMEGVMLEALPIAGSGILNFLAKNVTINSKLYLKRSADGKSVTIDKLHNTSFIIEKVLSRTEYDKNIDDVMNAMVEDLLAGYLTRFSKYIAETYEDYTVNILNSILDKMKFCLVLVLCALAAAAPSEKADLSFASFENDFAQAVQSQDRSFVENALVLQLFRYLRHIINHGSAIFNIGPLDPLVLDYYHLNVPAGLINLDLNLKNSRMVGFGGFQVKKSHLDLSAMTFDVEIAFPKLVITAEEYDLVGDLYSAIPLFGKGNARFVVENFTFGGKLFLKQSEDKRSILIERIENPSFDIPALKSQLTGVIGGGDIDAVANAITEDVIIAYVNRFQAAIASMTSNAIVRFGNPLLDQLDSWRFIAPFLPRPRV
ncbi:hypothetical protein ABMA28_011990 [Loxostege sticticalis]|uniref:Hemolymph juvenile hormone binding protein n=1 Tax=Loxostege sticticalis TaxID=481309 RepID=A0ABD0TL84_LOXSC